MEHFENILLVTDGKTRGEAALKRASTLAKNNQAQLTVVEVVEKLPRDLKRINTPTSIADMQKLIIRDRLKHLENIIAPIKDEGVRVTAKLLIGTPFLEIIREVLRNNHDLVIITAECKGGLKEMLFGTTTMHLMRKCPCPVWAIKPAKHKRFSRILAAVDKYPSGDERNALNDRIMELASSLARSENSELHIIHTWSVYGERSLRTRGGMQENELYKLLHEIRNGHKVWLDELVKKYTPNIPKKQVYLLKGEAGALIPSLAEKKRIELIVIGTVSRTGIDGLLIGNTAERVLQQVDCSVLAIKPDGFVSPVKLLSASDIVKLMAEVSPVKVD
ncbi:hypothetical protein BEH94_02575 [Candidatus Altiarchaeales archaeon WOR_SM1_SCG]|nr:hypothetical protein BEH94_02575 [Candidatus Altiarchaeales archaeon WOR_SM1_SCG]